MNKEHPDFVTVCKGMGFFASHWSWTKDDELGGKAGGYYGPWCTVSDHYRTADEAERAAEDYANAVGIEFKPWTAPYRTLEEANRYDAIRSELMQAHIARIKALKADGLTGKEAVAQVHAEEGGPGMISQIAQERYLATATH